MHKFRFFAIIFLNVDNSVNIEGKPFKVCVLIIDGILEGTVSQIYILGPISYFLLFTKFMKYFAIFVIKKEPRHK